MGTDFSTKLPLTTEVRPGESEMAEGGTSYFGRTSLIRENHGPLDFSSPLIYPQNGRVSTRPNYRFPQGYLTDKERRMYLRADSTKAGKWISKETVA